MAAAGVEAVEDDKGAVIAEIRLSRRRWWNWRAVVDGEWPTDC
jgi:hypothetical protein